MQADVLFVLVEEQAKQQGIDAAEFGASLTGDILNEGKEALTREYYHFFPNRERETIIAAIEKMTAVIDETIRISQQQIAAIDPALEARKIVGNDGEKSLCNLSESSE